MKTLSKKLAENLAYYTKDVSKRCVDVKHNCRYSGKSLGINTKGCFVGALLPPKLRLQLDSNGNMDVKGIVNIAFESEGKLVLPKIITENTEIMTGFQRLHDDNNLWNSSGLNETGLSRLETLVNKFDELDMEDFKGLQSAFND